MTLELITTLSNVVTLVLLLGAAIAAIVQLRHVRATNELAAVLAIDQGFAAAELQDALVYVQDTLASKLQQANYRLELVARGYVDSRNHPEMTACNWFNEIGAMVAGEIIDERLVLDSYGRLVEHYWRLLGPAIALLRRERGTEQYANFEFLAQRAERWRGDRRSGIYPRGLPRMPLIDPWALADRSDDARGLPSA